MAVALIFFCGLMVWAVWSSRRAVRLTREAQRKRGEPVRYRSSGAGRVALRTYRAVGDVRAIARGTYGKRLIRRSAFKGTEASVSGPESNEGDETLSLAAPRARQARRDRAETQRDRRPASRRRSGRGRARAREARPGLRGRIAYGVIERM